MTELRNTERDLDRFRLRVLVAALFVLVCFGLLVSRLVWLQVVRYQDLAEQAEANRIAVVPVVPNRGQISDRNGVVLATNYSAYALEVTESKLAAPLEQVVDELSQLIDIQPRDRRRYKRLAEDSKNFEAIPIRHRLTDTEVARFTAQSYRFPGVEVRARLFRSYPLGEVAAHVVGYVGRIGMGDKKAMEDWTDEDQANYRGTDVIGKTGLEQFYEQALHGSTGFEQVETTAGGRAVRVLGSKKPSPGANLQLSIDIKLQWLVQQLFGNRRGALVAIDPRNGEVLAFVSMPTYDTNLFVDGIDAESWRELNESPDRPMLNRALRGMYTPGSTYKPFMAMAALNTGVRTPQQGIQDPGYFNFGNHRFRDDKVGGHGWVDMYRSIVHSCNTYYYVLSSELGVDRMAEQLAPFGFGQLSGIDLSGEPRGILPSTEWKKRAFRTAAQRRWSPGDTISLGIGQGYNSYSMLQLANATAILSTGGQRHTPHLARSVVDVVAQTNTPVAAQPLPPLPLKPEHVDVVRRALVGVNREGTSAGAFAGAGYVAAGKTGTSQVFTVKQNEKYNANRLAKHLHDHALYMVFAPAEAPRVALAVIVENSGFGAQSAAPIARRVLDYVLLGQWPSEADMAATAAGRTTAPIGTPRRAADIVLPIAPDPQTGLAPQAQGPAPASAPADAAAGARAAAAAGTAPAAAPGQAGPAPAPAPVVAVAATTAASPPPAQASSTRPAGPAPRGGRP